MFVEYNLQQHVLKITEGISDCMEAGYSSTIKNVHSKPFIVASIMRIIWRITFF